jgi:hypothetical protein
VRPRARGRSGGLCARAARPLLSRVPLHSRATRPAPARHMRLLLLLVAAASAAGAGWRPAPARAAAPAARVAATGALTVTLQYRTWDGWFLDSFTLPAGAVRDGGVAALAAPRGRRAHPPRPFSGSRFTDATGARWSLPAALDMAVGPPTPADVDRFGKGRGVWRGQQKGFDLSVNHPNVQQSLIPPLPLSRQPSSTATTPAAPTATPCAASSNLRPGARPAARPRACARAAWRGRRSVSTPCPTPAASPRPRRWRP